MRAEVAEAAVVVTPALRMKGALLLDVRDVGMARTLYDCRLFGDSVRSTVWDQWSAGVDHGVTGSASEGATPVLPALPRAWRSRRDTCGRQPGQGRTGRGFVPGDFSPEKHR